MPVQAPLCSLEPHIWIRSASLRFSSLKLLNMYTRSRHWQECQFLKRYMYVNCLFCVFVIFLLLFAQDEISSLPSSQPIITNLPVCIIYNTTTLLVWSFKYWKKKKKKQKKRRNKKKSSWAYLKVGKTDMVLMTDLFLFPCGCAAVVWVRW